MVKRYYKNLATCLIISLIFCGNITSFAALSEEINRWAFGYGKTQNSEYASVASVPIATPDEGTITGGQGAISGDGEVIDPRAELIKELTSSLSVSVPTELSFNIDLYEALEQGQIYSGIYYFQNFSKVDVRVNLESIYCEFSNPERFQALECATKMERGSDKKQIYLYLEQLNGTPGKPKEAWSEVSTPAEAANIDTNTENNGAEKADSEASAAAEEADQTLQKPGVVITDVPLIEGYSFILSSDPESENNKIGFHMTGEVNERSRYRWRSGEIHIKAEFSIEPMLDEALAALDEELAYAESLLDQEIPNEEDLYIEELPEESVRQEENTQDIASPYESTVPPDQIKANDTSGEELKTVKDSSETGIQEMTQDKADKPEKSQDDAPEPPFGILETGQAQDEDSADKINESKTDGILDDRNLSDSVHEDSGVSEQSSPEELENHSDHNLDAQTESEKEQDKEVEEDGGT